MQMQTEDGLLFRGPHCICTHGYIQVRESVYRKDIFCTNFSTLKRGGQDWFLVLPMYDFCLTKWH